LEYDELSLLTENLTGSTNFPTVKYCYTTKSVGVEHISNQKSNEEMMTNCAAKSFFKNNFWVTAFISLFNTQTTHIKSIDNNSIALVLVSL
jgi:hypothetical protein